MKKLKYLFIVMLLLGIAAAIYADIKIQKDQSSENSSAAENKDYTPSIGLNFNHYKFGSTCTNDTNSGLYQMQDNGIVENYHEEGIRENVVQQLKEYRAIGYSSIRVLVWHGHDASDDWGRWGVINSQNGLIEPYKTNFMNYVSDIKEAGFTKLIVSLGPMDTNNPMDAKYITTRFDENWSFLQQVREVAKQYGPSDTRIDIINEGAPRYGIPNPTVLKTYLSNMIKNYSEAYGVSDMNVSIIGLSDSEDASSIKELIKIIKAQGINTSSLYAIEVHIYGNGSVDSIVNSLKNIDNALTADNNSTTKIIIGETYYGNANLVTAINKFVGLRSRQIDSILTWPVSLSTGKECLILPPYNDKALLLEYGLNVARIQNDNCIQVIACGEDGNTYSTPCEAERAGVKVMCYHTCPCDETDETPCKDIDANNDSVISLVDLSSFLSKYNSFCTNSGSYGACGSQDTNSDGKVSLVDLANLLSRYKKDSCSI